MTYRLQTDMRKRLNTDIYYQQLRTPLVGIASKQIMIDIQISINNGNEAFGTSGKTITVNEQPKSISLDFVAEELHHRMPLVPADVISQVLVGFQDVAARMMAEGFAIQGTNAKGDVLLRYYTDARLKNQSINLAKAKELMPDTVTNEQSMVDHAGELVALAGVQLRPYVEVQQKFHELLGEYKPKYEVKGIVEKAYVAKKDGTGTGDNTGEGGNTGGGNTGGGDNENLEP